MTKPMLCKSYDDDRLREFRSIYAEPKLDGIRVIAHVDTITGDVKFTSRGGNEFPSIAHLAPVVVALCENLNTPYVEDGCYVLDGEVTSGSFNDTASQIRRLRQKAEDAVYHIFDFIAKQSWDNGYSGTPLAIRRNQLEYAMGLHEGSKPMPYHDRVKLTPCHRDVRIEDIDSLYDHYLGAGLEGLILKDATSPYNCGVRSKRWLKLKAEETLDLPIIDVIQGGGKYSHCMGAIVVSHKGKAVNVGTGFSDEQREVIWHNFINCPTEVIGRTAEVRFQYETPAGSLRHPSFYRIRVDK